MQGFERMDRHLADVGARAGHLAPAGSMFAFLATHRAEAFPDDDYADPFAPPGKGRPSVSATQMAAVMTLQALQSFSDRETAEAARFDVRWKAAIGAALDDPGFDPSTLVYWRRLAASARPHRVNDAVRKVIEETEILRGWRRRAVDSTVLDDAAVAAEFAANAAAADQDGPLTWYETPPTAPAGNAARVRPGQERQVPLGPRRDPDVATASIRHPSCIPRGR